MLIDLKIRPRAGVPDECRVRGALAALGCAHIERLDVHIGIARGDGDAFCLMLLRLSGQRVVSIVQLAATPAEAIDAALRRAARLLAACAAPDGPSAAPAGP